MCKLMTHGQWLSMREAIISSSLQDLAQTAFNAQGKDTIFRELQEVLLDAGLMDFAAHLADTREHHSGKRAGTKGCWLLLF